jgi:Ca2+-binding EF-hand superfamily protein
MTEDYLIQIYQGLCCEGNVEPFAKQVFRTLDTNKDGRISFKELMISLIPTITGDIDDKLRWAFKMFDEDENNQISRSDYNSVISNFLGKTGC